MAFDERPRNPSRTPGRDRLIDRNLFIQPLEQNVSNELRRLELEQGAVRDSLDKIELPTGGGGGGGGGGGVITPPPAFPNPGTYEGVTQVAGWPKSGLNLLVPKKAAPRVNNRLWVASSSALGFDADWVLTHDNGSSSTARARVQAISPTWPTGAAINYPDTNSFGFFGDSVVHNLQVVGSDLWVQLEGPFVASGVYKYSSGGWTFPHYGGKLSDGYVLHNEGTPTIIELATGTSSTFTFPGSYFTLGGNSTAIGNSSFIWLFYMPGSINTADLWVLDLSTNIFVNYPTWKDYSRFWTGRALDSSGNLCSIVHLGFEIFQFMKLSPAGIEYAMPNTIFFGNSLGVSWSFEPHGVCLDDDTLIFSGSADYDGTGTVYGFVAMARKDEGVSVLYASSQPQSTCSSLTKAGNGDILWAERGGGAAALHRVSIS